MVPLTSVGDFYDGDEIPTTATRMSSQITTDTTHTTTGTTTAMTARNGERT